MELEFHQLSMKYEELRVQVAGLKSRLMASLIEQGQLNPVLVVQSEDEANKYVLIDGYQRVSGLSLLGKDTVCAILLPLSESAALIFRHCQENANKRSALEDGWLLKELIEIHSMTQTELALRLQRSESWVSRRLSLVNQLPESVQKLVRLGQINHYSAMKYFVPLARAKKSDCEKLAQNIAGQNISSREMEQIYLAYKGGDLQQKLRVIENPLLLLKAQTELKQKPLLQTAEDKVQKLYKSMEILEITLGRALRCLRELEQDRALSETVIEIFNITQSSYAALAKAIKERINKC